MKSLSIVAVTLLMLLSPLACSKTYTLVPLSSASVTPVATATATPGCGSPQILRGTPPSGVVLYGSVQSGVGYGIPEEIVTVDLLVNGAPVSTAAVTISGPGLSMSVPYFGTDHQNGNTYAQYKIYNSGVSLSVGDTYTITAITTAGTASAASILPPMPTVELNGSGGSWAGPSQFNFGLVNAVVRVTETFYQNSCASAGSISIPGSAYPDSENYVIEYDSENYTTTISGGLGYWCTESINIVEI
jgi:hypothetical protein